ncbi:hypothetical protein N7536_009762 [Penicillium majusculum]|nr:hypothetical protein N7536_009762 [Penicillium majusculum]
MTQSYSTNVRLPAEPSTLTDKAINRRTRYSISCEPCRREKVRCDGRDPCTFCKRRQHVGLCIYNHTADEGMRDLRPSSPHSIRLKETIGRIASSAFDEEDSTDARRDAVLQRPVDQMTGTTIHNRFPQLGGLWFPFSMGSQVPISKILAMLPPVNCCTYLITLYFARLSPLFHILHGPTFQKQFNQFLRGPAIIDLSWLALLFSICSAAVHTADDDDAVLAEMRSREPLSNLCNEIISHRFRIAAMICLSQDSFLVRHRLSTIEALLVLIYTINHYEGVESGWSMLGIASNIGIALKCNLLDNSFELSCIEIERRRRCWAGTLMLHTYQAISFYDGDMSFLLNVPTTMPADVNDTDIEEAVVRPASTKPTQMSVMTLKIRLFQLCSRICSQISAKPDPKLLHTLDAEVAKEQREWDSVFLINGSPSVLNTSSYAHWCILQLYAHQLYLILHSPFCRSRNAPNFLPASCMKCLTSGATLVNLHRKFLELPRLRQYRWYAFDMASLTIHGAMVLSSCLLGGSEKDFDPSPYLAAFDAAVWQVELLQKRSPICVKATPILRHLQFVFQ